VSQINTAPLFAPPCAGARGICPLPNQPPLLFVNFYACELIINVTENNKRVYYFFVKVANVYYIYGKTTTIIIILMTSS